jgi:hypothetical protein
MIIFGCINVLPKGCIGNIILKESRVLLIWYFLIQRVLVKVKLCVKYKNRKFHHKDIVTVEKVSVKKYIVGLHMKKPYVPYETLLERLVG